MPISSSTEEYSALELARAAGVPVEEVLAALGRTRSAGAFVAHPEAVRIGRALIAPAARPTSMPLGGAPGPRERDALFSIVSAGRTSRRITGVPLALSSTLHAGVIAGVVFVTTFGLAPAAAPLASHDRRPENMRLVFVATPGPGGGGGGGGLRVPAPAPRALREGRRSVPSPLPARRTPPPIERTAAPPEPPVLASEPLPALVAPIIMVPADNRNRMGVLEEAKAELASRGPGQGGGVGAGKGTGIGAGDGAGLGEGSGGGTGGGPFRPGSGIEPPRLLREIKADYSDAARRLNVEGEVVLEIIVRRDGTVGDVKMLRKLGAGLDERAVQAVRQWRFAPATRRGSPVDVVVEVAVDFRLR